MPAADDSNDTWWVACLCADWCGVCREWRASFEALAGEHPRLRFAWIDVEDEAAAMGDHDIETFPTLLVARGDQPLFLGPVLPTAAGAGRLLASLQADPRPSASLPADARALLARLQLQVLPRNAI